MADLVLYTIGFTKKPAERFFGLMREAGVRRLVDVRLNTTSQLAGFAKQDDLRYFLDAILGIEYLHLDRAAPAKALLTGFKKGGMEWADYEKSYRSLLAERDAARWLPETLRSGDCLLCSEHDPAHCHRRLLAEYSGEIMGGVEIRHLM